MTNMRNAQIARIISRMSELSLDELEEALDEVGAMDIGEAERNMHKLSGSSITRIARTVRNLHTNSQR